MQKAASRFLILFFYHPGERGAEEEQEGRHALQEEERRRRRRASQSAPGQFLNFSHLRRKIKFRRIFFVDSLQKTPSAKNSVAKFHWELQLLTH